jgi:iron complex transport system substrate-binding protein
MDAEDLICGVEDVEYESGRPYWYACPQLSTLPSIGPQHGGNTELILAQEPDVIFFSANAATIQEANEYQELTGIPVVALNFGDLNDYREDFYNSLRIIGDVLNKSERAEALINDINEMIEDLNNRTENILQEDKYWCYVGGVSARGGHGITSTEIRYSSLEFINGKNSAENVTTAPNTEHAYLDLEQLFEWQDNGVLDYIIIDGGGYDTCITELKNSTEGAAGALECAGGENPCLVMVLPYNWYHHNYATVFANAYYLGKRFFSDQFSDLDYSEGKIYDEIYKKFLGEGVYSEMAAQYYGGFHNITRTEIDTYGT